MDERSDILLSPGLASLIAGGLLDAEARRRGGKNRESEGAGLAFFYFAPSSTIVSVPLASANIPFVFNEPTADFQTLTVQGQLTYRITDPKRASAMLDFTLDAKGRYTSDQYQKLPERLVFILHTLLRAADQGPPPPHALVRGD